MEVIRNQQEVRTENTLAFPTPINREGKYRQAENSSNNIIKIQKLNPVLTQLQLNMMSLHPSAEPLALDSQLMSIEEHFRKISDTRFQRDSGCSENQDSNKPLFLKLSAILRDSKCISEEPETYFNGCSNDVSRISERIDIYQLLDGSPDIDLTPILTERAGLRHKSYEITKETALGNLKPVLKELLLRNNIERCDAHLSGEEIAILAAVIQKKLGLKMKTKQLYRVEELKVNENLLPKRRAEECYKFIFKHAFKHLQVPFNEQRAKSMKAKKSGHSLSHFYEHYFGEVSRHENIDISNFYLPLTADAKGLNLKEVLAKTINTTYIALACQSPVFVADLLRYLQCSFMRDYENMINKKIDKIVGKWESSYLDSFCPFKTVETICDFLVHNKKTKLPWFYSEVEEARKLVMQLVSKQQNSIGL